MPREYLFRGQRIDNKEWVYGSLLQSEIDANGYSRCQIHERFADDFSVAVYDVIPETVGQYTGLTDKKGNKIWEGDILSAKRTVTGLLLANGKTVEVFGAVNQVKRSWDEILIAEIKETKNSVGFTLPEEGGTYQERGIPLQWEIIGNIHDNPELLAF